MVWNWKETSKLKCKGGYDFNRSITGLNFVKRYCLRQCHWKYLAGTVVITTERFFLGGERQKHPSGWLRKGFAVESPKILIPTLSKLNIIQ